MHRAGRMVRAVLATRTRIGSLQQRQQLLSTTAPLSSATPDWQELVGGRAAIEHKRAAFENKYRDALERKARDEGVSVEELKARGERKAKADGRQVLGPVGSAKRRRVVVDKEAEAVTSSSFSDVTQEVNDRPSAGTSTNQVASAEKIDKEQAKAAEQMSKSCSDNGVKPLHEILDLSRATSLTTAQISALWTTYHQQKGMLSAVIPTKTYERMSEVARKYPLFVLPLARDPTNGADGQPTEEAGAVEMHLLQWAFLPPPSSAVAPIPAPSTVLFTPLLQYQTHQTFAQPYLILTHYADLAPSHDVVLMRGEVTDSVPLSQTDAQLLSVRMQLFYNWATGDSRVSTREAQRKELLRTFHERPQDFDLEQLVKTAWELD